MNGLIFINMFIFTIAVLLLSISGSHMFDQTLMFIMTFLVLGLNGTGLILTLLLCICIYGVKEDSMETEREVEMGLVADREKDIDCIRVSFPLPSVDFKEPHKEVLSYTVFGIEWKIILNVAGSRNGRVYIAKAYPLLPHEVVLHAAITFYSGHDTGDFDDMFPFHHHHRHHYSGYRCVTKDDVVPTHITFLLKGITFDPISVKWNESAWI